MAVIVIDVEKLADWLERVSWGWDPDDALDTIRGECVTQADDRSTLMHEPPARVS